MAFAEPLPESTETPRGPRNRRDADDRSRRHRGELAVADAKAPHRRMCGGGQGQRLRAGTRAGHRQARQGRLQDFLRGRHRRSAACAHTRTRCRDLRAQRIRARSGKSIHRTQRPAGDQQHRRTRRVGCLRRRPELARRRGDPCGHRHEPPRHAAGRSRRAGAARSGRKSRHHVVDEPPRLRGGQPTIHSTRVKSGSSASCVCSFRAFRLRSPTPPESSSASRRISIWEDPAPGCTDSIRRRASPTRCARWSN